MDYANDLLTLPYEECVEYYPEITETARKLFPELDHDDVSLVVSLVVGTCPMCYREAEYGSCLDEIEDSEEFPF